MKDDFVYLQHILHCIQRIEEDSSNGYEFFSASPTHQDAVMRNLQIMAESTQRLSEAIKDTHPEAPWRAIAGFRNVSSTITLVLTWTLYGMSSNEMSRL